MGLFSPGGPGGSLAFSFADHFKQAVYEQHAVDGAARPGRCQPLRHRRPQLRIGACALLVRNGEVLLGHRSSDRGYYPNVWDMPGGHVRPGESPEAAMIREVAEEIGCIPIMYQLVEVRKEPNPDVHGPGEFHVFLVTEWDGPEPQIRNAEHDKLAWFTATEAMRLELADPGYVDLLRKIDARF